MQAVDAGADDDEHAEETDDDGDPALRSDDFAQDGDGQGGDQQGGDEVDGGGLGDGEVAEGEDEEQGAAEQAYATQDLQAGAAAAHGQAAVAQQGRGGHQDEDGVADGGQLRIVGTLCVMYFAIVSDVENSSVAASISPIPRRRLSCIWDSTEACRAGS